MALAYQCLALRDAEFVLLVDNDKAELVHLECRLDERMCPDEKRRRLRARSRWQEIPLALDSRLSTLDGFPAARLQLDGHAERLKPACKVGIMLFSQNLRGRHERDVVAAFQGHQRAARSHGGLARAHVALQQAAHGKAPAQVRPQFTQDASLRRRELEAELAKEWADEAVVAGAGERLSVCFQVFAPSLNRKPQLDELVQRQPLPGLFRFL